ncbi:MAG: hypothetical protein P4L50_14530 [Anaerolineaceae bacterium]|nr:hypothetical protein [Anaerolineaceae bacterium]
MTMQVGMIGTDGIILASDIQAQRRMIRCGLGTWHTSDAYKIKISTSKKIVASCAMDMCESERIASELLTTLDGVDIYSRERKIIEIARTIPNKLAVECFVAFIDPDPWLFLIQHPDGSDHPIVQPIIGKAFAGDALNPAAYWAERYYCKMAVGKLKHLAAHVIAEAGILNPALIGGLDIVIGKDGEFSRLSQLETDNLIQQSGKCEDAFGQSILS